MTGLVREDSTGRLLAWAEIAIPAIGRATTTDITGRFVLTGIPAEPFIVRVGLIGYHPKEFLLTFRGDTVRRLDVSLVPQPFHLAPLVTTATPDRARGMGIDGFDERRALGFGTFFDSSDLRRQEHRHLQDLFLGLNGVQIVRRPDCVRSQCAGDRNTRYAASTRMSFRRTCLLEIVLDGTVISRGGTPGEDGPRDWHAAFDLNTLSVSHLQAIEVYRGASEVPAEYAGGNPVCGVILLWSKRG